jgi:hypothetical protein
MDRIVLICVVVCWAAATTETLHAQDIRVPTAAYAGEEASVSTTGSGKATFYLIGPGTSRKSDVSLGEEIHLKGQDLRKAGKYLAIVCSSSCSSATFYVTAAKPASLAFLVHPSRVPVSLNDAVSGVALPFDQFHNLVLAPVTVNFELTAGNTSSFSRQARTQDGVAWFRTASSKSARLVQAVASLDDISARRAVQQVASDPCNLRIKGLRTATGVLVETELVHDCAGNIVSDGTIVTFTATEGDARSTVDTPIKKGVARAQIEGSGAVSISVASGVVLGNELRIGAKP